MATTLKTDIVRARIETATKKEASAILKRLGVSHSTFINMSYRAVIETKGIPFSLHIPNAQTAKILREANRGTYTQVATFDELLISVTPSKK